MSAAAAEGRLPDTATPAEATGPMPRLIPTTGPEAAGRPGDGAVIPGGAPASAALRRVADGYLCAGCGACAALAPGHVSMEYRLGHRRPVQREALTAEQEARIARICPGLGVKQDRGESRPPKLDHPVWGPIEAIRAGHSADPELRQQASSGGALSAFLVHLLETGAVDFVLETGPDEADPMANATVISRDRADVARAAGSRYAPSAPLAGIEPLLAGEARFAFVGKPCDVAALRAMGRDDPRVAARVPVMLSFFCAGAPSLRGARKVVEALGAAPEEVSAFRYRGDGWPGRATATLRSGERRGMSYADSWGEILSRHVPLRCKICVDGIGEGADIVCADAWQTDERGYPLFEEADGSSLIITRTAAGEALARAAEAAGWIETKPLDTAAIDAMQPHQLHRRQMLAARLAAMAAMGWRRPRYRGFHLLRAAAQGGPWRNLKDFLGMIKRLRAMPRAPKPRR